MKLVINRKIIFLISLSLMFLFVVTPVLANFRPYPPQPRVKSEQTATPSAEQKDAAIDRGAQVREKLSETRLRVCEKLETGIRTRSANLISRVNKQVARVDSVSTKVQDFYTEKMIPEGITVENYDTLVNNIQKKEEAVNNAVANAQSAISSFTCDSDGPKAQLAEFKTAMKEVITAVREYRKSVVDLIVAVRTALSNANQKEATGSAN